MISLQKVKPAISEELKRALEKVDEVNFPGLQGYCHYLPAVTMSTEVFLNLAQYELARIDEVTTTKYKLFRNETSNMSAFYEYELASMIEAYLEELKFYPQLIRIAVMSEEETNVLKAEAMKTYQKYSVIKNAIGQMQESEFKAHLVALLLRRVNINILKQIYTPSTDVDSKLNQTLPQLQSEYVLETGDISLIAAGECIAALSTLIDETATLMIEQNGALTLAIPEGLSPIIKEKLEKSSFYDSERGVILDFEAFRKFIAVKRIVFDKVKTRIQAMFTIDKMKFLKADFGSVSLAEAASLLEPHSKGCSLDDKLANSVKSFCRNARKKRYKAPLIFPREKHVLEEQGRDLMKDLKSRYYPENTDAKDYFGYGVKLKDENQDQESQIKELNSAIETAEKALAEIEAFVASKAASEEANLNKEREEKIKQKMADIEEVFGPSSSLIEGREFVLKADEILKKKPNIQPEGSSITTNRDAKDYADGDDDDEAIIAQAPKNFVMAEQNFLQKGNMGFVNLGVIKYAKEVITRIKLIALKRSNHCASDVYVIAEKLKKKTGLAFWTVNITKEELDTAYNVMELLGISREDALLGNEKGTSLVITKSSSSS